MAQSRLFDSEKELGHSFKEKKEKIEEKIEEEDGKLQVCEREMYLWPEEPE